MSPIVFYLITSVAVASLLFLVVTGFRPAHPQSPGHAGLVSLIGGVLWPLMLAGLLELAAVVGVRKLLVTRQHSVPTSTQVLSSAPELVDSHA